MILAPAQGAHIGKFFGEYGIAGVEKTVDEHSNELRRAIADDDVVGADGDMLVQGHLAGDHLS
jgi:hypothetical protein